VTAKRFLRYIVEHKHYFISFAIQTALAGFLIHGWDGFVFATSAEQFLHGITPYEIAAQAPAYTFCDWTQMWYAYPPLPLLMFSSSYAPYFFLIGDNPFLGRIFLKLTFILGNLLCAYLIYKLVAGVSTKEKASKAEKMILYNPFLIFIAAAWGMFDIWMVNFLLASLLSLRRDKFGQAGVYFGLSLLIKPIPVIFAPLLLAHVWNKRRTMVKPLVFAFAAVAVFSLVSLPFFLSSPQGFTEQVFGMHMSRPPFGWAPLGLLYVGEFLGEMTSINLPSLSSSAISAISIALLTTSILVVCLYYCLRRERGERGLLASLFLLTLTFTLFTKGMSPQHFVIPLVLAVALLYAYSDYSIFEIRDIKRYYKFLVLPYLGAAIMAGHHYFFIPSDVVTKLSGGATLILESQVAAGFPISPYFYHAICDVIMYLLVAPAVIMAGIIVFRSFKRIIPIISSEVSAWLLGVVPRIRRAMPRKTMEKLAAYFLISVFVIMPPLAAMAAQSMSVPESPPPSPPPLQDRLVGVFYYIWENPAHRADIRYGSWLNAGLTPEEGYYESSYGYIRQDIQQMKDAGIDFIILPFHDYNLVKNAVFIRAVEDEAFRFAPMIELEEAETKREIIGLVDQGLRTKDSPAFLIYDDKPVVFVTDVSQLHLESWEGVEREIEGKYGEVFWIGCWASAGDELPAYLETFDAVFMYSPAAVWQANGSSWQYWEERVSLLHESSKECSAPTIISTTPYFSDEEQGIEIPVRVNGEYSYDLFWEIALDNEADIVLIASWNKYQTSSAIEPTVEFGDLLLQKTEDWCGQFHASE